MTRSEESEPRAENADTRLQRRWRGGGLGRLMLVATTDLDGDGCPEICALAGRELKVYGWSGGTYHLRGETVLPRDGLSLAAGLVDQDGPGVIAVGARDSVMLYALSDAGLGAVAQSLLFPGAYFRSVALADVNGDGRVEVVAAASGAQTLYVLQLLAIGGEHRLEELGRVYIGGLVSAAGEPGAVVAGTKDGYVDVYVPCALVPRQHQVLYAVRRGDSLWRLARQFGTSAQAIARANRLAEPYRLTPGQILLIPRHKAGE